jgi:hypothetical protein
MRDTTEEGTLCRVSRQKVGEPNAMFERLERAYAARDVHLIFLPVDQKWDPFRTDPRFVDLVARCGFPSSSR